MTDDEKARLARVENQMADMRVRQQAIEGKVDKVDAKVEANTALTNAIKADTAEVVSLLKGSAVLAKIAKWISVIFGGSLAGKGLKWW